MFGNQTIQRLQSAAESRPSFTLAIALSTRRPAPRKPSIFRERQFQPLGPSVLPTWAALERIGQGDDLPALTVIRRAGD